MLRPPAPRLLPASLALALTFAASLGACGGSSSRPLAAVDSYVAALRSGDYARAYDYMSERYKREHTRDDFVKMLRESPEDVRDTIERLSASGRKVEVSAKFVYDDLRDEISLVDEQGQWRLANNPLDFYPQDTPTRALRSFVRAVELKRWDVVRRFVPNKWKDETSSEKIRDRFEGTQRDDNDRMMRLLAANLDNPVQQEGDDARMPYGDRFEVKFHREDGIWKIVDPD